MFGMSVSIYTFPLRASLRLYIPVAGFGYDTFRASTLSLLRDRVRIYLPLALVNWDLVLRCAGNRLLHALKRIACQQITWNLQQDDER